MRPFVLSVLLASPIFAFASEFRPATRATVIDATTNAEASPRAASDGSTFLIAWVGSKEQVSRIVATRIGANGVQLDEDAFEIATVDTYVSSLRIIFGGST